MKHHLKSMFDLRAICIFTSVFALIITAGFSHSSVQAAQSLKVLLGSWGGSGVMKLKDGASERVGCNGYYTGGGSQLGMVIRCTSGGQKIEIRSKLSVNNNNLSGKWEERSFNAEGSISGKVTGNQMKMSIQGAVTGSMNVHFTSKSQKITIVTDNIGMSRVSITLYRK